MKISISDYELNSPRGKAKLAVDKFNHSCPVGTPVTYLKSELEGRQLTKVESPAFIQGDSTPMVKLEGIGTAHLEKIERL